MRSAAGKLDQTAVLLLVAPLRSLRAPLQGALLMKMLMLCAVTASHCSATLQAKPSLLLLLLLILPL